MEQPEPRNILILGTSYSGKSYAAGYAAANISRDFVVIVSHQIDEAMLEHIQTSKAVFMRATPRSHVVTSAFLDTLRTGEPTVRYLYIIVEDLHPEQVKTFLRSLVSAVKKSRNLCLIIDEAHAFCDRVNAPKELLGFGRGARHYGVDLILVTHRLYDVDVSIRCVLTHLVLFKTIEGRDLDELALRLDLGDSRARVVAELPLQSFLFVNRRLPGDHIAAPDRL